MTKAYVRSPTISIGGGKEGFDGLTVGLQGFDNPYRDQDTNKIMTQLQSQCCKLQMDSDGFVEIQKVADTEAEFRILGNFGEFFLGFFVFPKIPILVSFKDESSYQ